MTAEIVEGVPVVAFATDGELWAWLAARGTHPDDPGVWVRLARSRSPRPSVTFHELLAAGIAHGWSESGRRAHDQDSYLQRFSPRRRPGTTSARNQAIAAQLTAEGRMTPAGMAALKLPHGSLSTKE